MYADFLNIFYWPSMILGIHKTGNDSFITVILFFVTVYLLCFVVSCIWYSMCFVFYESNGESEINFELNWTELQRKSKKQHSHFGWFFPTLYPIPNPTLSLGDIHNKKGTKTKTHNKGKIRKKLNETNKGKKTKVFFNAGKKMLGLLI